MKFCSDHSRTSGEPVAGLGYLPRRMAVLTWPRAWWRSPVAEARQLPEKLRDALKAADPEHFRVQLVPIPKGDAFSAGLTLYLFPQQRVWADIDASTASRLIRQAAKPESPNLVGGAPYTKQMILCCTDSKVDACCAKFGRALSRELERHGGSDPAIDILETTHVGGCRLAASCIVLPQRARYSRLSSQDVPPFLQALRQGGIYSPCYRGDPDRDELHQVVLAEARLWAFRQGRHGEPLDPVIDSQGVSQANCRVRVKLENAAQTVELRVCCRREDLTIYSNCSDLAKGFNRSFPRWVAGPAEELA